MVHHWAMTKSRLRERCWAGITSPLSCPMNLSALGMRAHREPLLKRIGRQHWAVTAASTQRLQASLSGASGEICLRRFFRGEDDFIAQCMANESEVASRKASQQAIAAIAPTLPELLGGSADLAGSNLTLWPGAQAADASDAEGNYLYYGVREFAMAALYEWYFASRRVYSVRRHIPYFLWSTARNAVRMASLMKQRAIYVFTHDSVGLGEDGPTHQPVEQLASMRSTPNLDTWRPCDAVESAIAWKQAILRTDGPSALVFSRQTLPHQVGSAGRVSDVHARWLRVTRRAG